MLLRMNKSHLIKMRESITQGAWEADREGGLVFSDDYCIAACDQENAEAIAALPAILDHAIKLEEINELLNAGWSYRTESLYDEEGIEGWMWTAPNGDEHSSIIGSWSDLPPLPDCMKGETDE